MPPQTPDRFNSVCESVFEMKPWGCTCRSLLECAQTSAGATPSLAHGDDMKIKRLIGTLLLVIVSPSASVAQQRAAGAPQNITYKFEAEPRAVLSQGNELLAKHPKLFLRIATLNLLAVYKNADGNSQLGLAVSNDGGDSFEPPVMISEANANVHSHGENSPTFAVKGIEFYALWEQSREAGGTELMFARSLKFGRKFDKPIRLTDKPTASTNGFSHLAVAPNGDIYAVWLDGRDTGTSSAPGTLAVYMAKSTDKGATFGKNLQVTPSACPCCRPSLAFGATGEVFVSWRQVFADNIRDIVVATSVDNGTSFNKAVRVAVDNWQISGCPDTGAMMHMKGKRLYITWHSEGTIAGIRIAWSDDGGKSFARPMLASGKVLDTNHPVLSLSEDGRMLAVFQGRDATEKEGWGALRAYVVEVNDDGSISQPVAVTGNKKSILYPTIAAGTVGRVFVAWTESTAKGANVFLSRGRREDLEQEKKRLQPSSDR
jgi:hypothetical protein